MKREVVPELLDALPPEDAGALRSRRDLRLINFLMGNERWLLKRCHGSEMIELGAGAGELTRKLSAKGKVTGLDFQEKPEGADYRWIAGDLFETFEETQGDTVVANLILHHFEDEQLEKLGRLVATRRRLIAVEPWRSRRSLFEGALLWPLINHVTKHDMMVSIRAGFRKGELPALLRLGPDWQWREVVSSRGGIRVEAWCT